MAAETRFKSREVISEDKHNENNRHNHYNKVDKK